MNKKIKKFDAKTFRISDGVRELLKEKRKLSKKSWNLFILEDVLKIKNKYAKRRTK
jgi:hypothetical protein